jgi:hypothetical protein
MQTRPACRNTRCYARPVFPRYALVVCLVSLGCTGGAASNGDGKDAQVDDGGACLPAQEFCQPTVGPPVGTCCPGSTCVNGLYANAGYCFASCGPGGDCGDDACCMRIRLDEDLLVCVPASSSFCLSSCDPSACSGARMCQYQHCCGRTGATCSVDFDCCLGEDGGKARCTGGICE